VRESVTRGVQPLQRHIESGCTLVTGSHSRPYADPKPLEVLANGARAGIATVEFPAVPQYLPHDILSCEIAGCHPRCEHATCFIVKIPGETLELGGQPKYKGGVYRCHPAPPAGPEYVSDELMGDKQVVELTDSLVSPQLKGG
jgi:hypothetical protein